MIRVALDAMGGDLGPRIAFESALQLLSSSTDVEIHLYYHHSFVSSCASHPRLKLIPCTDYVAADEAIDRTLFRRKQTSLYQAIASLSMNHADVVVTLGNTGVMVALARHLLGLIKPKLYPALIRELRSNPLRCLVDLGANIHCPATMLHGFACLGGAYLESFGLDKARVGLLNVGVESSKGSSVIRQADALLEAGAWPEYAGYAEGYEIFKGDKNIIVCDGVVGNAVLKASEGLLAVIMGELASPVSQQKIESLFQSERRHGACLVGVRGNLVKGHGGSDVAAMVGAITYGIDIARVKLSEQVHARLLQGDIQ